jgi:hypothetical protein
MPTLPLAPLRAPRWRWFHRIVLSVLGAYAFTWGASALAVVALVAGGLDFHEAEHGVLIAAFLVYLAAFLWAFAAPRLGRVWWVLGGGAVASMAAALLWQRVLMS